MTVLDRVTLLTAGLIAIYLLWRFYTDYRDSRHRSGLYFMTAFGVLLAAGLLLIAFTYEALAHPLVVIVAVLIPAGLSLGVITKFFPSLEKPYMAFVLIGLAAITITRLTGPGWLATATLISVHATSGVIILAVPIWQVIQGDAPQGFLWVSVGGLLIDTGGMALAFLKAGGQLLFFSESVVYTILGPLLFLMTLSFARGFTRQLSGA